MEEIEDDGRVVLETAGAADERETGVTFEGAAVLLAVTLGLEETRGFLTASDTDARGRDADVADAPAADATEPVGEATELRAGGSVEGLLLVEADKGVLADVVVEGLAGTTDDLRDAGVEDTGGLEAEEDIAGFDVAVGAEVVGFFRTGAVGFAAVDDAGLVTVGLTLPAPNVPEFMI